MVDETGAFTFFIASFRCASLSPCINDKTVLGVCFEHLVVVSVHSSCMARKSGNQLLYCWEFFIEQALCEAKQNIQTARYRPIRPLHLQVHMQDWAARAQHGHCCAWLTRRAARTVARQPGRQNCQAHDFIAARRAAPRWRNLQNKVAILCKAIYQL